MLYVHSPVMLVIPQILLMTIGMEGFRFARPLPRSVRTARTGWSALAMADQANNVMNINLEPEPEGGKELSPLKTLPNCRMKEIRDIADIKGGLQFWMTGQADGELVKAIRTQVLKEAAKKANFPGFRKGQVPPYAQPQITEFAVQESLIQTVKGAIEAFGLEPLPGSDGKLEVHEDVKEICSNYKTGDTIPFTATVNCKYGASAQEK